MDPTWVAKTDVDGAAFVAKVAKQFEATSDVKTRAELLRIVADRAREVKAQETARIADLPESGHTRAAQHVGSAQELADGVSFFIFFTVFFSFRHLKQPTIQPTHRWCTAPSYFASVPLDSSVIVSCMHRPCVLRSTTSWLIWAMRIPRCRPPTRRACPCWIGRACTSKPQTSWKESRQASRRYCPACRTSHGNLRLWTGLRASFSTQLWLGTSA